MKRTALTLLMGAGVLFLAGCRQDMHNQPKYRGLRPSTFFADAGPVWRMPTLLYFAGVPGDL